jgi:hypothetical protein
MREELQEVFDAVLDAADEKQVDRRELAKMFLKAVGLTGFVRNKPDLSAQEYVDLRWLIHETLGAPGDWGYGTRLGEALQKLYGATPPADAARADEIAATVDAVEGGNLGDGIQVPTHGGTPLPPCVRRSVRLVFAEDDGGDIDVQLECDPPLATDEDVPPVVALAMRAVETVLSEVNASTTRKGGA